MPEQQWVGGADGCRAGWVVVRRPIGGGVIQVDVHEHADAFLRDPAFTTLGIDVPIGLPDRAERGGRACDADARRLLGPGRGSSVFSAPVRTALTCDSYADALAANRASSPESLGISKQCFFLFPKIREVDALMTPALQERVVEVHPECSFSAMNAGEALASSKKSGEGQRQRLALLHERWADDVDLTAIVAGVRSAGVAADDIVDAMAICWTAERLAVGAAARLPEHPLRDARGLRMEIWR